MIEYNFKNPKSKIPADFFNFLDDSKELHRGYFLEKLAKYGDPSEFELPIGFKNDPNSDMTFTGVRTAVMSKVII